MKKYLIKLDPFGWEAGDKESKWFIEEDYCIDWCKPLTSFERNMIDADTSPSVVDHVGGRRISKYLIK